MEPAPAVKFNWWLDPSEISLLGGLIGTGTASLDVDAPQAWRYIAR